MTPALLAAAVAVAVYQVCFFAAVDRAGVAVGTVVAIGSGPVFAGLLNWALRGRAPSRRWAGTTGVAIAGCAALIAGAGEGKAGSGAAVGGGDAVAGVVLALVGGVIYAFYVVVAAGRIEAGAGSDAVMGVMFGGAAVAMTPVLLWTGVGWLADPANAVAALYLGVGTTGVAYLLYGRGLRTTPVATATTLALAEPAVAALLGLAVLGERLSPLSVGGLLLLGVSLVAVAVPEGKTRAEVG